MQYKHCFPVELKLRPATQICISVIIIIAAAVDDDDDYIVFVVS